MPKELYIGMDIDGLNKLCALPNNIKEKSVPILCDCIKTIYKEANKALEVEDEELEYVYLMKYFDLIQTVRQAKDYKSEEKKVRSGLGSNDQLFDRMDRLEAIQNSLKKRYEQRSENAKRSTAKNSQNSIVTSTAIGDTSNTIETNDVTQHEKAKVHSASIDCTELYRLMEDRSVSMLVMDCRHSDEFDESHLRYKNLINIPGQLIKRGLSAGTLQQTLNPSVKTTWSSRSIMDRVILIDWNSKSASNIDSPIGALREILLHWDPDVKYSNSIQIVSGGYEMFLFTYPMLTTNPKFKPKATTADSGDNVGDIEYPSISDIKMKKDVPLADVTNRATPQIDRSSKHAAMKTYDHRSYQDIIKMKEERLDTQLAKEIEAIALETDLEQSFKEELLVDDTKKSQIFEKQREIKYKILQYDNERDDIITEREELDDELDDEEIRKIDELAAQRIRAKELESQRLELERRRKNEENERMMLARDREQKRKIEEEQITIRPKQPSIDRSVKPIFPSTVLPSIETHRNFAPEYGNVAPGLTGLKNLGNTCYMNSIIQCLSNVVELCKYFRTGHFKSHLNRKSQTQGAIAREFAAVCHELWTGKYRSIAPSNFRSVFGAFQEEFSNYKQQDSHEFLIILIDYLHSELEIPLEDITPIENLKPAERAWLEFLENKQSFVMRQFYGQTRSTVKCRVCKHESATYEGFSNLSFELPQFTKQCDLKDCMDMYFGGETINGWHCPMCKCERGAIKKLDICRTPPILAVHLKRFEFDLDSSMRVSKKIQNYIHFPVNKFNIGDYVTRSTRQANNQSINYNLCAVSNHYGTVDRGHYTAFCKNYNTNSWYKFDDNCVSALDESKVVSSAAYILFYSNL